MEGSADDLIAFEHQHYSVVVATLHAPLDAVYCLEVLVLCETNEQIGCIADISSAPRESCTASWSCRWHVQTARRPVCFCVFRRALQESLAQATPGKRPCRSSIMS